MRALCDFLPHLYGPENLYTLYASYDAISGDNVELRTQSLAQIIANRLRLAGVQVPEQPDTVEAIDDAVD